MSLQVTKVLFWSFLRWNRRPAVVQISVEISLGVHGAIYFCFRKPQACQTVTSSQHGVELVEAGFGALRHLNELGETLTKGLERQTMDSLVEVFSRAEFPVGQVVVHRRTGCRLGLRS